MKVSVILPIYNGESTLANTLDSLVEQSFQDFELVVCIDGSKDSSLSILKRYESQFKVLRIFENDVNRGLGPTMNRLVSEAKGDYIAVAEQDDYYYPYRLQMQVDVMDNDDTIGMVSGVAEFWDGKKASSKFPGLLVNGHQYPIGETMFLLNYRNQIKVVNSCMMFRKSVHIDNGLYFTQHYPSVSVDWTYVLRFSLIAKIFGIYEVLVKVDRRPDRFSVTMKKTKQFEAARELIRVMRYEYPSIVKKNDFRYALNTQLVLEQSQRLGLVFLIMGIYYSLKSPGDPRFLSQIWNRIMKRFQND